ACAPRVGDVQLVTGCFAPRHWPTRMNDCPSVFPYYPCAPVNRFRTVEEMSNPRAFFACRSVAGIFMCNLAAERSGAKPESEFQEPKQDVSSGSTFFMRNKASSIAALCGHHTQIGRPLPSAVALEPQSHPALREIFEDD